MLYRYKAALVLQTIFFSQVDLKTKTIKIFQMVKNRETYYGLKELQFDEICMHLKSAKLNSLFLSYFSYCVNSFLNENISFTEFHRKII